MTVATLHCSRTFSDPVAARFAVRTDVPEKTSDSQCRVATVTGKKEKMRFYIIIFLLSAIISSNAHAASSLCYDKADKALTNLKTWNDLRLWYESYRSCDDGYLAEGISEFVARSLARQWNTIRSLKRAFANNPKFKDFVLKHIDSTVDTNDLTIVVTNCKTKCPADLRLICEEIENATQAALKEMNEIKR